MGDTNIDLIGTLRKVGRQLPHIPETVFKAGMHRPHDGLIQKISPPEFTQYFARKSRRATGRMSQTTWATLHGLCRLKTDGVFVSLESVEEISLYAADMILSLLKSPVEFV